MPLTLTAKPQATGKSDPTAGTAIRANRYDVLSRLADDLAHEIKNPLNAIVINLEVMRHRIGSGRTDAALERAAVIGEEIGRVQGLVDQLLRLLRPGETPAGPVAIDGIIEALAPALQIQAKAARVSLALQCEPDLYVRTSTEALTFGLLNLIVRAIDVEAETQGQVHILAHRAAQEIHVVVGCAHGLLTLDNEHIGFCRVLIEEAGGVLESLEPNRGSAGSTATVAMPAAGLAGPTTIRETT